MDITTKIKMIKMIKIIYKIKMEYESNLLLKINKRRFVIEVLIYN